MLIVVRHGRTAANAAGLLLVREAGGRVTDYAGRDARVIGGPIVASNGVLHDWFLDLLNAA